MVTARAREDRAIFETVARLVALEEGKKPAIRLRPLRTPSAEELDRRHRHLAATEQLRTRLGKIGIPADELVRLGRERADCA